jgi:copper chaperone CopZ
MIQEFIKQNKQNIMKKNLLKTITLLFFSVILIEACNSEKSERPLPPIEYISSADASESKAILQIEGMMCEHSCVASIKQKVSALAGVNSVEVNFEEDLATVTFDPSKISELEIIKEIQRINDNQYTVTKATVEQAKTSSKATSIKDAKHVNNERKVFQEVAIEDLEPKIVFPNIFGLFQKMF